MIRSLPLAVLAAALVTAAPAAAAPGGTLLRPAAPDTPATDAHGALVEAQSLFAPPFARSAAGADAGGDVAGAGRDATMALRELAMRFGELGHADRGEARGLLARPTDGAADPFDTGYSPLANLAAPVCDGLMCIHYVTTTTDAPDLRDVNGVDDGDGVPDYVEATLATFQHVYTTEVTTLGYRAPLDDSAADNNGGDGRFDVYLADLGNDDIYGYCAPDFFDGPRGSEVSGFCVVDDDFDARQFPPPSANGLAALRVTAAHEFFHAVQFAYDWREDGWLMEGTAAWMEDEVYDAVNDNRQYLPFSALGQPWVSLDTGRAPYQYGAWIFWRYLTEHYETDLVRQVWDRVDSDTAYSLAAVRAEVESRGTAFHKLFAKFSAASRTPGRSYAEGAAYPKPPTFDFRLGVRGTTTGWFVTRMNHLSSDTVAFRPNRKAAARGRIKLRVDGPGRAAGTAAVAVVVRRNGDVSRKRLRLDGGGAGAVKVAFGRTAVKRVELVLVNGSTRYGGCFTGTVFACKGHPRDQAKQFFFRATAVR